MGISVDAVLIAQYSVFSATALICTGDINDFIEIVEDQDEEVEGTALEGALIVSVISNIECDPGSVSYDESSVTPESPDPPESASSDFGRPSVLSTIPLSTAVSTFDFPSQRFPSPNDGEGENDSSDSGAANTLTMNIVAILLMATIVFG